MNFLALQFAQLDLEPSVGQLLAVRNVGGDQRVDAERNAQRRHNRSRHLAVDAQQGGRFVDDVRQPIRVVADGVLCCTNDKITLE